MSAGTFAIAGPRNMSGRDLIARLGAMRERVTLKSVARAKDAGGFASNVATTVYADLPAEVASVGGREIVLESGQRGQIDIEVRIRYLADVTSFWEVAWAGLTYQVLAPPVNHDGRKRFLWLQCGRVGTAQAVST